MRRRRPGDGYDLRASQLATVEQVDGPGLERVLRDETRLVLVEFEAAWCEPCRQLRPQIETLARERADLCRVVTVDADAHPELVRRHGVEGFPTLVFFKAGQELHRFKGGALPPSVLTILRRSSDV